MECASCGMTEAEASANGAQLVFVKCIDDRQRVVTETYCTYCQRHLAAQGEYERAGGTD